MDTGWLVFPNLTYHNNVCNIGLDSSGFFTNPIVFFFFCNRILAGVSVFITNSLKYLFTMSQ